MRPLVKLAVLIGITACSNIPQPQQQQLHGDELFHRAVKHHQKLISSLGQASRSTISYEDAAFRINLNHRKEAMRVLSCAKAQDGFEGNAIYQVPPRYELHFYFKGNAEEKLSHCTHDPLFFAHNVKYGFDELKALLDRANALLETEGIAASSIIRRASHLLFETKPYPASVLSEDGYIKIMVEKKNFDAAKNLLAPLIERHDFLFLTEGTPYIDEILTDLDDTDEVLTSVVQP